MLQKGESGLVVLRKLSCTLFHHEWIMKANMLLILPIAEESITHTNLGSD
jgi:hypothetical protein